MAAIKVYIFTGCGWKDGCDQAKNDNHIRNNNFGGRKEKNKTGDIKVISMDIFVLWCLSMTVLCGVLRSLMFCPCRVMRVSQRNPILRLASENLWTLKADFMANDLKNGPHDEDVPGSHDAFILFSIQAIFFIGRDSFHSMVTHKNTSRIEAICYLSCLPVSCLVSIQRKRN